MIASFTRNSTAHLQNGTLVNTNLPRFEAGRFAQAVMVEEGTTNLLLQSAAFTVTPWARVNVSFTSQPNYLDFITTRVTPMSASATSLTQTFSGTTVAGRTFTWSFWARGETTRSFGVNFWDGLNWQTRFISLTPTWQRFELTNTFLSGGTFGRIQWGNTSPHWGTTYMDWIDLAGVQLEERPYATTYMETGATIAARAAEVLTIPTAGILSPAEGTIEFWWQPINQPASNMTTQVASPQIMRMGTYFNDNSWVLWNLNGALSLFVRGAGHTGWTGSWQVISGSVWHQLNRWYHISIRWSGTNTFWVFVDGVRYGPYVSTHPFTGVAGNVMALGGAAASGGANAFIDDLRISNRARTDQEIADAFASNQPLPVDASTTYLMRMDGNLTHGQGGDYVSPEYDLSTVGTGITSAVNWQAPADGVTREVAARLDGQTWASVTNGGPLPFTPGQLLTGRRIQLQTTLRRG